MTFDNLLNNLMMILSFTGPINNAYTIITSLFFYINIFGVFGITLLTLKEIFLKTPLNRHPEEDKP